MALLVKARSLKRTDGFTLVEIMLVLMVTALIAAIAVPVLLRARHNANETTAVENMRTLSSSLESFRSAQTPAAYPADLSVLSSTDPIYIDSVLSSGSKQGYNFTYTLIGRNQYTLLAAPQVSGITGTRSFFTDQNGVIRVSPSGIADSSSTPLD